MVLGLMRGNGIWFVGLFCGARVYALGVLTRWWRCVDCGSAEDEEILPALRVRMSRLRFELRKWQMKAAMNCCGLFALAYLTVVQFKHA